MTKSKSNAFIHIIITILAFMPFWMILLTFYRSPEWTASNINGIFNILGDNLCMSLRVRDAVMNAFTDFGIPFNRPIGYAVCATLSNYLCIYFGWLCAEVMLFIPKFALKMIRRSTDV